MGMRIERLAQRRDGHQAERGERVEQALARECDALGEAFDPHAHDALLHAPHASVPAGHVSQVVARGFRQGDRVQRAARDIVSSGLPGND